MSDFKSDGRGRQNSVNPEKLKIARQEVIKALATVKQTSIEEVDAAEKCGASVAVSAKEGMAVIALAEDALGRGPLLSPKDLAASATAGAGGISTAGCMDPAEDTSVDTLSHLIASKL